MYIYIVIFVHSKHYLVITYHGFRLWHYIVITYHVFRYWNDCLPYCERKQKWIIKFKITTHSKQLRQNKSNILPHTWNCDIGFVNHIYTITIVVTKLLYNFFPRLIIFWFHPCMPSHSRKILQLVSIK